MLVIGLNDEMKTSMHRLSSDFISKWYRANHGAKDGILVHSD